MAAGDETDGGLQNCTREQPPLEEKATSGGSGGDVRYYQSRGKSYLAQ